MSVLYSYYSIRHVPTLPSHTYGFLRYTWRKQKHRIEISLNAYVALATRRRNTMKYALLVS